MAGQNSVPMAVTEPCRLSSCREFTEERQGEVGMKTRLLLSSPLNAIVVTLTILALLLYCVRLISATGTTLGDPAASMQPETWATLTNPVNKDQSKQVLSLIFSCQHSSPLLQEVEIAVRKKYSNWRYV